MKGIIVVALKEMVTKKFGADKWTEALKLAGFEREPLILSLSTVDDQVVMKVIDSVCRVLNISFIQAADAFGDFWVNDYVSKVLPHYFKGIHSAREFLLNMDHVHVSATKSIHENIPPRFNYEWKDEKTLLMKYNSNRGLIDLMPGLIKGVARYYNENLRITKLGNDKVEIQFAA